jgi:hypothetical protein
VVAGVGLGCGGEEQEGERGGGGFFHGRRALFTILIWNAIYFGRYRVFFTV